MSWYNPFSWFDGEDYGESERGKDLFESGTPPAYAPGGYVQHADNNSLATKNAGTTWSDTRNVLDANYDARPGGYHQSDVRSYMYGRDPSAAQSAVDRAWSTGDSAMASGRAGQQFGLGVAYGGANLMNQRTADAQAFNQRGVLQGDYGNQNATLGQLMALEQQRGPSAAQAQLQSGTNQAMASQLALARSGRGMGGNAAAMGLAQGNMAGIQANQANQAAMLRAQEDAAWRQRQAGNMGTVAGMQGQQSQANLGAALQSRGQNDAMYSDMIGRGQDAYFAGAGAGMQGFGMGIQGAQASLAGQGVANDIRGQELNAGLTLEDNVLRQWAAKNDLNLAQQQRQDQQDAAALNAGSTLAAAWMMSDVRAKKGISRTDAPALDFARAGSMVTPRQPDTAALDAVAASPGYGYQYIDPGAPGAASGQQYGPMAQDLASTPAGSTAVVEGKDGKLGIDPARLTTLNTSAISAQQRQLDEIMAKLQSFGGQGGASYPITRKVPY